MGVCHRDLKPENLLLDGNDNLKISDFGLSALYTTSSGEGMMSCRAELLHTTCGTPNYVAPEVLEDEGYDGRKADIWSMGVILYVLVVGSLPFDEKTLPKLFEKIRQAKYLMPSFVSRDLSDLIKAILNADPKKRFSITDIKSHAWYCHEDSPLDKDHTSTTSGYGDTRVLHLTSSLQATEVMKKLREHLIDVMGFKLDKWKDDGTMKAMRITPHGMIGVTISAIEMDGCTKLEIRKRQGDLLEYNAFLHELTKKKLEGIFGII